MARKPPKLSAKLRKGLSGTVDDERWTTPERCERAAEHHSGERTAVWLSGGGGKVDSARAPALLTPDSEYARWTPGKCPVLRPIPSPFAILPRGRQKSAACLPIPARVAHRNRRPAKARSISCTRFYTGSATHEWVQQAAAVLGIGCLECKQPVLMAVFC